jgi:hypothetical protein
MTGMGDPVTILEHLRDESIHVDDSGELSETELEGKFVIGKLVERPRSEFGAGLRQLNAERRASLADELGRGLRTDTSSMETGR